LILITGETFLKKGFSFFSTYGNKEHKRSGSRREMGRGFVGPSPVMIFARPVSRPAKSGSRLPQIEYPEEVPKSQTIRDKGTESYGPLNLITKSEFLSLTK
jgi:hypothetical protein